MSDDTADILPGFRRDDLLWPEDVAQVLRVTLGLGVWRRTGRGPAWRGRGPTTVLYPAEGVAAFALTVATG